MSEPLHRLVYRSTLIEGAAPERRRDLLAAILDVSSRRNALAGITGALLHDGETVLQVLEGPLPPLEETYDRISADLRHCGLALLQLVPIPRRSFAGWRMVLVPADRLAAFWPGGCATLTADEIPRLVAALLAALPAPPVREAA